MTPPEKHTVEQVTEPLDEWAEKLIDRLLLKHAATCPLVARVSKLEIRWAWILGMIAGGSGIGGVVGALINRAMGS